MRRRKFVKIVGASPVAFGLSSSFIAPTGCQHREPEAAPSVPKDDEQTVSVPRQFRLFQFYAPFTSGQLSAFGVAPEVWYSRHVPLDYDRIRTVTNRVSDQSVDGAGHPSPVNIEALLESDDGRVSIPPFLNHGNPNSHIIIFGKPDLNNLLAGRNVYLATGFHQGDHFHIAMVKPDFAQAGTLSVNRELLDIDLVDQPGSGDEDGDGVLDAEDRCLGSTPGVRVWDRTRFNRDDELYETADRFHGCHQGQAPRR